MEIGLLIIKNYILQFVNQTFCYSSPLSITTLENNISFFGEESENNSILHYGKTDTSLLENLNPETLPEKLKAFTALLSKLSSDFYKECDKHKAPTPTHWAICVSCDFDKDHLSLIATALNQLDMPSVGIFYTESVAVAPLPEGRYLYVALSKHSIKLVEVTKKSDQTTRVDQITNQFPLGFERLKEEAIQTINTHLINNFKVDTKKSIQFEQEVYSKSSQLLYSSNASKSNNLLKEHLLLNLNDNPIDINLSISDLFSSETKNFINKIDLTAYQGIIIDNRLEKIVNTPKLARYRYVSEQDSFNNLKKSLTFKALADQFTNGSSARLIKSIQSNVDPSYHLLEPSLDQQPTHLLINNHLYSIYGSRLYLLPRAPHAVLHKDPHAIACINVIQDGILITPIRPSTSQFTSTSTSQSTSTSTSQSTSSTISPTTTATTATTASTTQQLDNASDKVKSNLSAPYKIKDLTIQVFTEIKTL